MKAVVASSNPENVRDLMGAFRFKPKLKIGDFVRRTGRPNKYSKRYASKLDERKI